MSEYSRKHLTHSRDILPTLSGVVQRFGEIYREKQYIAGFWGIILSTHNLGAGRYWLWCSSSTSRAGKVYLYNSIDNSNTAESELYCLEVIGESMVQACTDIGWSNGTYGSITLILRKDIANENTYQNVGIVIRVPSHFIEVLETEIVII